MSKYIDADRLKAEIEKHIKEVKDAAERFTPNMGFFDAKLSGIYDVMAIIDSLQHERQKSSNNWKPSEEQMKALQNAVALTACDKELVRLYNQLKKL